MTNPFKNLIYVVAYLATYFGMKHFVVTDASKAGQLFGAVLVGGILSYAARAVYRKYFGISGYGDLLVGLFCFAAGIYGGLITGLPAIASVAIWAKWMAPGSGLQMPVLENRSKKV